LDQIGGLVPQNGHLSPALALVLENSAGGALHGKGAASRAKKKLFAPASIRVPAIFPSALRGKGAASRAKKNFSPR
jgi:hypothetical protein